PMDRAEYRLSRVRPGNPGHFDRLLPWATSQTPAQPRSPGPAGENPGAITQPRETDERSWLGPDSGQGDFVPAVRPASPGHDWTASRPKSHHPTKQKHHAAKPYPPDQRVDVEAVDRLLCAFHRSSVHDVEVFLQIAPDADLGRGFEGRPLEAVHVLPLFRDHQPRRTAILGDFHGSGRDDAIEGLVLRDAEVRKAVGMPEGAPHLH